MEDFQREEELWLEIMIDGQLFVNRLQVPVGETGLSEVRWDSCHLDMQFNPYPANVENMVSS